MKFLNVCYQHIPMKFKFSSSHPCYSKGLKMLKNKRNRLHKRYLKSKSDELLCQYKCCAKEF